VTEVLRDVELVAVILAAGAVIALAIRGYLLARRLHRLADEVGRMIESDARRALAQVEEAARGVQRTSSHIDAALVPLSSTVHRIERWTAAIAAEALVASAVSPALAKIGEWLSGLRKVVGRRG
jgi:hypothetical protein